MLARRRVFSGSIVALSSILYFTLHNVTNIIDLSIKQPYMDEIFHVPQAQQYCQGKFNEYDPKLTTPPGLYLISYAILWLRDMVILRRDHLICDTIDLRRINHIMAVFSFMNIILIQIVTSVKNRRNNSNLNKQYIPRSIDSLTNLDLTKIILNSIAIITLPPLFFFYSLYYTDIGSLLFTLLVYYFSITNRHLLASIFGFIAITFRQTNIVWVFYVACLTILKTWEDHSFTSDLNNQSLSKQQHSGQDEDHKSHDHKNRQQVRSDGDERRGSRNCSRISSSKMLIYSLIKNCTPYAIVGALFGIFVLVNGGIVLGDKEAHQPKLHMAQILYFLGFCSTFGASWIFQLRILKRFLYFTIRSPLTAVIACTVIIYLISTGRYAHPYLLADNRHITFYIWRRILDRHNSYVPYMLTPIYLISSFSVWHHLRGQGCKRVLLFIFCSMLVLVPNGLFELRYFIIPYILLRLHADVSAMTSIMEISTNVLINFGMSYLFLHKTFRWSDSQEIQRIMW